MADDSDVALAFLRYQISLVAYAALGFLALVVLMAAYLWGGC